MGDTGSDEVNPLVLALRSRYPDAREIMLTEGAIIIEFPTTVLTFLMSEDTLDFYHAMLAGEPISARNLHIWRAVMIGNFAPDSDKRETVNAGS